MMLMHVTCYSTFCRRDVTYVCYKYHRYTAVHRRISQTRAGQRLRPVAISARLAPSHASYHGPEIVWVTGRLMLLDRGFGPSCLPIQKTVENDFVCQGLGRVA